MALNNDATLQLLAALLLGLAGQLALFPYLRAYGGFAHATCVLPGAMLLGLAALLTLLEDCVAVRLFITSPWFSTKGCT